MMSFARGVVWDDRHGSPGKQKRAKGIGIVGSVGHTDPPRRDAAHQRGCHFDITALARGQAKFDGSATAVGQYVDFGAATAARAADILAIRPPFPPADERCAFAVVLSMQWASFGLISRSASNNPCQKRRCDQRYHRL